MTSRALTAHGHVARAMVVRSVMARRHMMVLGLIVAGLGWAKWFGYVSADLDGTPGRPTVGVPLWARAALGAVIVIWGARTDRPWSVPLAATLCLPVLWFAGLSVLTAALPLRRAARAVAG